MKKTRFASFLLTGKAATLPFMINNSLADVTPSYYELMSQNVNIIEMPSTGVRLLSTTASAPGNSYGGQTYGGGGTEAAQICSASLPGVMNVVVTGVRPNDSVFLVASTDKDDQKNLAVNPNARIGSANFTVVSGFKFNAQELGSEASNLAQTTSSVSVQVDMKKLQANHLFSGGTFYLQAFVFPTLDPDTVWQQVRISELDAVSVSSAACTNNMYGSPSPYGGTTY